MNFRIAFAAALIGALVPFEAEAQLPNGACSAQDAACSIEGDNLLAIISGVATADDCRQGCGSLEKHFGLSFGLKNTSRFQCDSETYLNCTIFELFLSVGNLKPKFKCFCKPKLKPTFFY